MLIIQFTMECRVKNMVNDKTFMTFVLFSIQLNNTVTRGSQTLKQTKKHHKSGIYVVHTTCILYSKSYDTCSFVEKKKKKVVILWNVIALKKISYGLLLWYIYFFHFDPFAYVCYHWMEKSSFDIYPAKNLLLRSKNKVIQVSNDMNASKRWQNSHIWVNYHFKSSK